MREIIDAWLFPVLLIACAVTLSIALAADPAGTNTATFYKSPTYTFATLPAAQVGTVVYISDGAAGNCADGTCTTFGTNVTGGGGALQLLIWNNGVHWTLMGK
jgi:hypothetical protein